MTRVEIIHEPHVRGRRDWESVEAGTAFWGVISGLNDGVALWWKLGVGGAVRLDKNRRIVNVSYSATILNYAEVDLTIYERPAVPQ